MKTKEGNLRMGEDLRNRLIGRRKDNASRS